MGLDAASVKFLCAARSLGVDFARTVMIGRQSFSPDLATLRRVFSLLGIDRNAEDFRRENDYSEPFFSLLGAKEITSLDYSPYEEAGIIHDMNASIPSDLREQFSVVYDGGTLEHIFNIPQALKNCMEMVRIGGHFMQVNVANNYMGHGFWQFSPELIFRVFSPANGYKVEAVFLHEVVRDGAWYAVTDPDQIHSRVELCNSFPTYILTVAKRVARAAIFSPQPLQSDYVADWQRTPNKQQQPAPRSVGGNIDPRGVKGPTGLRRYLPEPVKGALKAILEPLSILPTRNTPPVVRGFKKSYYRRISEDALLRGRLT